MAGRPQETVRTGPTYRLSEFMNSNWDMMVGRTNEDVAQELGYKAANMISMWRTGKTRISLEKLPDIARIMKLDIATLLPLWFEQYWGERDDVKPLLKDVANRIASTREVPLLEALRAASPVNDPHYSKEQVASMSAVAFNDKARAAALAAMPKPIAPSKSSVTEDEAPSTPD